MPECDDLVIYKESPKRQGWSDVTELSAGILPYYSSAEGIFLHSKTGKKGSFTPPKGHVKIINGVIEDLYQAGIRELIEEFELDPQYQIAFDSDGFYGSIVQHLEFEKSKEFAHKRVQLFGAFAQNGFIQEGPTPSGKKDIRLLTEGDLDFVHPDYNGVVKKHFLYHFMQKTL